MKGINFESHGLQTKKQNHLMGRPYKEVFIRKEWCSPFGGCTISFLC
jgi:hypothetical protein